MTGKHILTAVAAVVLACFLSAIIGYRRGKERSRTAGLTSSGALDSGGSQPGCVDYHLAGSHTGENGCVSGRVLRVYTSRSGNTFLDFCQDYRSCPFSSVIFASDRPHFGNLGALMGRKIEIVGEIVTYGGRAEIVIHGPNQIRESQ